MANALNSGESCNPLSMFVGGRMKKHPLEKPFRDSSWREKPEACIQANPARLREHLEFLALILDSIEQPYAAWNVDGSMTKANEAFCNLAGYTREELSAKFTINDLIAPELRDTGKQALAGLLETGKPARFKSKFARKDESRVSVELAASLLCDEAGNPVCYSLFCSDVTEPERCEAALQESRAELDRVEELTHLGSYVWDITTGKGRSSDEFYRIFGVGKNAMEPTFLSFAGMIHPDDRQRVIQTLQGAAVSGIPGGIDYRIVRADGIVRWVHGEGKAIYGADGSLRMYGTIQDITDRKIGEDELNREKNRAELFLDLMGHDIRNMNQIGIGYLEMALENTGACPENKTFIKKSLDSLHNSSKLIDNVRKLQKVETHELRYGPVNICPVLSSVRSEYLNIPGRKVTIDYLPDCECYVNANELLRDVFSNIIGNAIKHSTGPLSISITVLDAYEAGQRYCKITIEDNGPGIPPELKGKLFTRFQRGTTRAHGRGLGLYLVKALVDDFSGRIWIEDRVPGNYRKGARFVVMLPAIEK